MIEPKAYDLLLSPDNQAILRQLSAGAFEDPALFHLRLQAENLSLITGFDKLLCVPVINVVPFLYQLETAETVLRRFRGRALLADEVGLGKTIEAGLVLKEYLLRGLVRKVLIITPPALMTQWREEMDSKFRLDFVTNEDEEFKALGAEAWSRFDRVIASLSTARREPHSSAISGIEYDMIVIDEAHRLKSRTTVSWQFANALKKKYILLLTATPVQNSLEELYNMITILKPGQLKTSQAFKRQFVVRGDPRLPKNRAELRGLLAEVMVRNTRSNVSVRLPRRHAHTIKLRLTEPEQALYQAVSDFVRTEHPRVERRKRGINRFVLQIMQEEIGSSPFALLSTLEKMVANPDNPAEQRRALSRLYEQAQAIKESAKAAALLKILKALSDKAIVFTKYRETQRYLEGMLREAGYSLAVYHGGLSVADKDGCIADFERRRQILLCTEAAGEGRNLQFCNTMINYDLPWNPMRIEQRVGRIHRIGQNREVSIYNLSAEGTIESYILHILDAKINMFELVIGEMDMILGNLEDERDFEEIVLDIWLRSQTQKELESQVEALGEELVKARQEYFKTKDYEDKLFGQDFRTGE
jgi:SNF2 family DNA or RNA helicase